MALFDTGTSDIKIAYEDFDSVMEQVLTNQRSGEARKCDIDQFGKQVCQCNPFENLETSWPDITLTLGSKEDD